MFLIMIESNYEIYRIDSIIEMCDVLTIMLVNTSREWGEKSNLFRCWN